MSTYSTCSNWLTALGGTFTRASNASYYNSSGTLSTASTNDLRFDYNPVTLAPKGILLEGARTNLCPQSEGDSNWAAAGTTPPTVSTSVAQDGRTCVSVTFTTGSDTGYGGSRATGAGFSIDNGVVYTASYEVKFSRALVDAESVTIFVTGSQGGWGTAYSSANCPTAFTRESTTEASLGNYNEFFAVFLNTAVGSDVTVYITRRQFEAGAFASSYIPTTSGSATRAADSLTFPTSPWFNASAGTFFVEADAYGASGTPSFVILRNSGFTNYWQIYADVANQKGGTGVVEGGVGISLITASGLTNNSGKLATALAINDNPISVAGNTVSLAAPNVLPSSISTCLIGYDFFGHIRKVGYWPFRVTNSELQRLTT